MPHVLTVLDNKTMKEVIIILTILFGLSCNRQSVKSIEYQSNGYDFNDEIINTLNQTEEIAFCATSFSFVSEYELLLKTLEKKAKPKKVLSDSTWLEITSNYKNIKAEDFILEKAKEHEIIMFNENHFIPKHRNFVKKMLPKLFKLGYRNLAIEAIGMLGDGTMYDKELTNRGYPIVHTGHYIKEPEFSLLIREAINLGFNIIGYDEGSSFGYGGADREERGAENIISQINNKDKLIVLCGWDHLKEGNSGTYWDYALAERLKQKTGKDPLTLNQTEYTERFNREFEKPLLQRVEVNESTILVNSNNEPLDLSKDISWYDAFIIHPRTKFVNGIPNWVLEEGEIKEYDFSNLKIKTPFKIFVFESTDDIKLASPIFVSEVSNINKKIEIPTRGKNIKLIVTNKKESLLIE